MDVKVAELVSFLASRHYSNPISQLILLQELLCQVLDVALGVMDRGGANSNESSVALNGDSIAQRSGLAVQLDAIVEVVLKCSGIKDLVG